MSVENKNSGIPLSAESIEHIKNMLAYFNKIKELSISNSESMDFEDESANRFLGNEIYLNATDGGLKNSMEYIGQLISNDKAIQSESVLDNSASVDYLTEPSEEIIQMAFGTFTTASLGRDAWELMKSVGLEKTLEQFDVLVIKSLAGLDEKTLQNLIEDFVSNAHSLSIRQRKTNFIEVKRSVQNFTSIEEVMDYLTLDLEKMRAYDPVHESNAIEYYTKKAIDVFEDKLQSKEITLNDVPRLISRYGLMSTYEFMRHIDEMMQAVDVEKVRLADDEINYGMGLDFLKNEGYKFSPMPNSRQWKWSEGQGKREHVVHSLDEAIDEALQMKFPERAWEAAIEKDEFEGSWDQFIRTELSQKHSEICMHGGGHYIGAIQKIEKGIVYQKVGRNESDVQLHSLMKFDIEPNVGDKLDIKYKDGKLNVKKIGKEVER